MSDDHTTSSFTSSVSYDDLECITISNVLQQQSQYSNTVDHTIMTNNHQMQPSYNWPTVLEPGIMRIASLPSVLLRALSRPQKVVIESVVTLHLNGQKQIKKMDMGTPVILSCQ